MEILEAFYFLRLKRDFILKLARNYLTRETLQPFPMQRLWFHGSYAFWGPQWEWRGKATLGLAVSYMQLLALEHRHTHKALTCHTEQSHQLWLINTVCLETHHFLVPKLARFCLLLQRARAYFCHSMYLNSPPIFGILNILILSFLSLFQYSNIWFIFLAIDLLMKCFFCLERNTSPQLPSWAFMCSYIYLFFIKVSWWYRFYCWQLTHST